MWWKNAIIYEVYVDKFAKDFKGLTAKLPYLKELGINCIWLLPHYPSPMVDDGYDVSDYMNVRQELGTLEDFKLFTKESHRIGIRVITDLVLNHVSNEHPWFKNKKDFFIWSKTGKEFSDAINPFSHMKKSNWIYDNERGEYYFATFYPEQPDLNWDNSEVFNEMMRVIDFWIGLGVDGFRLDAAKFLIKREGTECVNLPETHAVLKKIRSYVEGRGSDIILLAEVSGPLEIIKEYFGSGDECHMAFHFNFMSSAFLSIKRNDPSVLGNMIKHSANIPGNCQWATFLRNHDELTLSHIDESERAELLSWFDPEGKYHFKGGHGTSMRLAEIFRGDKNSILNAFKLLLDSPGSPVIYYGDELGMRNLRLKEMPADSRLYVRGNFDWEEAKRQNRDSTSLLNKVTEMIKKRQE